MWGGQSIPDERGTPHRGRGSPIRAWEPGAHVQGISFANMTLAPTCGLVAVLRIASRNSAAGVYDRLGQQYRPPRAAIRGMFPPGMPGGSVPWDSLRRISPPPRELRVTPSRAARSVAAERAASSSDSP